MAKDNPRRNLQLRKRRRNKLELPTKIARQQKARQNIKEFQHGRNNASEDHSGQERAA